MKCKKCGEEINLTIFGLSNDICWGCLNEQAKKDIVDMNVSITSDVEDFHKKLIDGTSHMVPRKYLTNTEK